MTLREEAREEQLRVVAARTRLTVASGTQGMTKAVATEVERVIARLTTHFADEGVQLSVDPPGEGWDPYELTQNWHIMGGLNPMSLALSLYVQVRGNRSTTVVKIVSRSTTVDRIYDLVPSTTSLGDFKDLAERLEDALLTEIEMWGGFIVPTPRNEG